MTPIEKWRAIDGDNTLALDWPLDEYSSVWEIGGFEGRWAKQISDKFGCFVTIFEPQLWAVQRMMKTFEGHDKVEIRPYGLWTDYGAFPIGNYHTDGASLVKDDGREPKQLGWFVDVRDLFVVREDGWADQVTLGLMNIEGGEYTLIPYMLSNHLMGNFKYFWCQFHPENENDDRHLKIFSDMERYFDIMWDYYPTAVAWRRR